MTRWTHDAPAAPSRRRLVPVLAGAAALALAVTVTLIRPEAPGSGRAAAATTAAPTTSTAARPSTEPVSPASPPTTVVPAAPDPAHEAELRAVAGGLWVLTAQSKDSTPVRPAAILPVLVDGVIAAFG